MKNRKTIQLKASPLHTLHVVDTGGKDLPCAVFLHGGPGSGCRPAHINLFPLVRCRVIAPDQRGCGQSLPLGELAENTTDLLLADLEMIRAHLGIEKWLLVGGSWGSLLALVYAQKHPAQVSGLVLRSLFFGSSEELERAFLTAPSIFYPEAYERFIGLVSDMGDANPLQSYYRLLLGENEKLARAAAFVWHDYERLLSQLKGNTLDFPGGSDFESIYEANADRTIPRTPKMEAHYFSRDCFLKNEQILAGMDVIKNIPGIIVQARYDMLCPPESSQRLLAKWPGGKRIFVDGAGHSQSEPEVAEALSAAISELLN